MTVHYYSRNIDALQSDVTILIDEAMTSVKETTLESEVLGFDNTGTGFLNKLTFPFGKNYADYCTVN